MITFRRRRLLSATITAILTIAFITHLAVWQQLTLAATNVYTGYILFTLILLLITLNFRKKITVLPIGSAASWLQIHIYLGILTCVVFGFHLGHLVVTGPVEIALEILFILAIASGIFGLIISRKLPAILTARGEDVIFERIPILRKEIANHVQQLMLEASKQQQHTIINFYQDQLITFFNRPKAIIWHLLNANNTIDYLLEKLSSLDRYMDKDERQIAHKLQQAMVEKNNLDYQYALQLLLKTWLFIHIPLSYALLLISIVHGFSASIFFQR